MAKKRTQEASNNLNDRQVDSFVKGLSKDTNATYISDGFWTHARNAVNNTVDGDMGTLSNERSNYLCGSVGRDAPAGIKKIIGAIHLYSDKWVIFSSVNDEQFNSNISLYSEIGLFEEDACSYKPIVIDQCLNFSMLHLVTGASKEQADCTWGVYWADGNNPDRYLNIGDPKDWPTVPYLGNNYYLGNTLWPGVQWKEECEIINDCEECTLLNDLDCDKTRLARLVKTPCVTVSAGQEGGALRNGSYFVVIAYSIEGQKVTNWFSPSNVQPLWNEEEPFNSLEINLEVDNVNFDEFILCVVSTINQGTVAKQVGFYSTNTTNIQLDQIKEDLITIPISEIPIQSIVYEKSDMIEEVNNYLLRIGPTGRFDFNYQPLANLIKTKWVSVEYDSDYYVNQGYKPSYLRDEVYTFFIRWVYNTGDKSSSYHIPGRPARQYEVNCPSGSTIFEDQDFENVNTVYDSEKLFENTNTASITLSSINQPLDDGGIVKAEGEMGYWESTEIYPDDKPEVWNSSAQCFTATTDTRYDLCGKPIRHHKFPEQNLGADLRHYYKTSNGELKIQLLGVKFENIIIPKDNDGNDIPDIVGYEILRGSREGNRSILAKGMINNMRPYINTNNNNITRGLYPNHPFNTIQPKNPGPADGSLNNANEINDPYIRVVNDDGIRQDQRFEDMPKDIFTFHSPDTNFRTPWLSAGEFKLYGVLSGTSNQYFTEPDQHPKHKLLSNNVLLFMVIGGLIEGVVSLQGKRTINFPQLSGSAIPPASGGIAVAQFAYNTFLTGTPGVPLSSYLGIISALDAFTGFTAYDTAYDIYNAAVNTASGLNGGPIAGPSFVREGSVIDSLGLPFALIQFGFYFVEGADLVAEAVYAVLPERQYALQMQGHGLYDKWTNHDCSKNKRFGINTSNYIKPTINDFVNENNNTNYKINNLFRQKTVLLSTKSKNTSEEGPHFIQTPGLVDQSLFTLGTSNTAVVEVFKEDNKTRNFQEIISSHYGAIKLRKRNQYGQLNNIKQIPITPCEQSFVDADLNFVDTGKYCGQVKLVHKKITSTPIFFNGDTYINRYTEKNNMFFFYDWLYGQPDNTPYNYFLRQYIPQPRFWMNSIKYDISDFFSNILSSIGNFITSFPSVPGPDPSGEGALPTGFYRLDNRNYNYTNDTVLNYPGEFGVRNSYFYLATTVVRDFFVESDVIVDFREEGAQQSQKTYNPYRNTDLFSLLNINPDVIKKGNYYQYDYSLSVSKLFTQYFSQGNLQSRNYDPEVSSSCYVYYPDRIVYSLPQQLESLKDAWFTYLVNNYKEFRDQISGVKNFGKTGILLTFRNASPLVLQGVDELQTNLGTKITLGDGGLFSRQPQNIVIADREYEYGSSQDSRSIISTPAGIFYTSQNQGKIFSYSSGLQEISQAGLKWWFNIFLPYKLLEDFPDFPHTDNPVAGIGIHASYDNRNSVLYFSKKDFKIKEEYKDRVIYDSEINMFKLRTLPSPFKLGDERFFDDASWTISYDPKSKFWISWHDWHPELFIATKDTFLTTQAHGIWNHNSMCNSYCNFYGVNYPFEIEIPVATGQTVNVIKSIEYYLECYKSSQINCVDQYHVLDFNFDKAIIHNTEQVSGYLNLNIYPKNNVALANTYPFYDLTTNQYQVLVSKEENKYRLNQFWDITKNRGEFPDGSTYPNTTPVIPGTTQLPGTYTEEFIWNTEINGYIKNLNQANLDYAKPQLQRKKFRHYLNYIFLSKEISNDVNMIIKFNNTKMTNSPR